MKQNEDGSISIVWNIEDVQSLDSNISEEQAIEVLGLALDNHDANEGINWTQLEYWIAEVKKWESNISPQMIEATLDDIESNNGEGDGERR